MLSIVGGSGCGQFSGAVPVFSVSQGIKVRIITVIEVRNGTEKPRQ
jgi:hypothetical protein